ncbi:MAG: class I SAM-dependent methyltransferase [Myxococcales bacterium]|nr:class I SAM-dependent methyltransferase [Myxococcales bacterium]
MSRAPGPLTRLTRAGLHKALARIQAGELIVEEDGAETRYGRADERVPLCARVIVNDPAFYPRAALGGTIGMCESYMDGDWDTDDLATLGRILLANVDVFHGFDQGSDWLKRPLHLIAHRLRSNSTTKSRRNIAEHYDLGNDLFERFLDPTLTYSAGIFEQPEASMEQASIAKYERICRKLGLGPEHHVLEIGTGWGGFALHAAGRHGCRVTTTTISQEQHAKAKERVRAAGLEDRITLLLEDYRKLEGRYDRCVSIEMIEAVGHQYLPDYFRVACERLTPEGLFCLQAITVPDQRFEHHKRSVDFIKRYIFPGGCLPSIHACLDACKSGTDFQLVHLEDITPHYAETLSRWREQLKKNWDEIRGLGYDERFLRLWEYYLCTCQAAFAERYVSDVQMILARPRSRATTILGRLD